MSFSAKSRLFVLFRLPCTNVQINGQGGTLWGVCSLSLIIKALASREIWFSFLGLLVEKSRRKFQKNRRKHNPLSEVMSDIGSIALECTGKSVRKWQVSWTFCVADVLTIAAPGCGCGTKTGYNYTSRRYGLRLVQVCRIGRLSY